MFGYTWNLFETVLQDRAYRNAAGDTAIELQKRDIEVIFLPTFSPVLNPIQRVWYIIKNYLHNNFSEQISYDRLRVAVNEAWETIRQDGFRELVESMPARC